MGGCRRPLPPSKQPKVDIRKVDIGIIRFQVFRKPDVWTNAFIQMSGVFAELELRIIRERVRSGMANAKAKGAKIGRPQATADDIPAVFLRHYPAFKNKQLNVSELARVCDLSRTTVYKYLCLLESRVS